MERKNTWQWDDRRYILNFEVKQRGDLNTNWCPAHKLRALLHPNWTKLWHRSWIYLYKCIVAGLFQLILQIPGPGFEIKFLQCQAFFSYSAFLLLCLYITSLIVFSPVNFFIYREAFLFYFNVFFLTGYLIYPLFFNCKRVRDLEGQTL